jgi:predicted unusual protein kinase regulating ubiquinone biosynthesis (AarF/ABC1/UbiB family)
MQYLDGFRPLIDEKFKHPKNEDKADLIASFEIVRLARYGFNHGDLHQGNIMVNMHYDN